MFESKQALGFGQIPLLSNFFDSQPFQFDPPEIQCHQNYIGSYFAQDSSRLCMLGSVAPSCLDNYLDLGG
jgi:hypothetical protein